MDAFIQQNSWIFSKESPFQKEDSNHHLITSPNTGIGWLRTLDKNKTFPILKILFNGKDHHWIAHNAVADVRGSRRRLELLAYKTFARLIPHDINGKMMGIDGVIDYWKDTALDSATALEDLQNIRNSLASVSQLANALGWLSKEGTSEHRIFTLSEIHSLLAPILPRLCKPATSFVIPPLGNATGSIQCAPHTLVFWSISTAILLSSAKESDEKIHFAWGVDAQLPTPSLLLEVESRALSQWVEGRTSPEDHSIQLFYDWLVMITHSKSSVWQSGNKLRISIPLIDLSIPGCGKILCVGHSEQSAGLASDFAIFVQGNVQDFVDVFSERLFSPTVVFLSPMLAPNIREIISGIISSVDESTLLMR